MQRLCPKFSTLSFYFILLLAVACKKYRSVDEQNENLQVVTFKVSGFSKEVLPLKSSAGASNASANSTPNYVEGYLYFWSFNNKTLEPDISYQTVVKPSIIHDGGADSDPYVAGYAFEGFPAGQAYTIKGAKEVILKIPIEGAEKITQFGFDTGSSDTGPKDFEIYYSLDEGNTYELLQLNNQFSKNGTGAPKNTYIYQLSDSNISTSSLWFKFIPKAGDRGATGNFNSTTGVWRFDNIRLVGMSASANTGGNHNINKLHYFLFHKDKSDLVISGTSSFQEASDLSLNLPVGQYSVCFISNNSSKDLILPQGSTAADFYVGNVFSNATADIFGYVGEINVTGDMEQSVSLKRLYSQVKLEFTDSEDLSMLRRIEISQQHEPLFYAPFNLSLTNPILDQSEIVVTADFNANKQLVFNQFMGLKATEISLNYQVTLYSSQGPIRTFSLQSAVKNNMQLVFRGNILESQNTSGKFQIQRNIDWGDQKTETF